MILELLSIYVGYKVAEAMDKKEVKDLASDIKDAVMDFQRKRILNRENEDNEAENR